MNYLKSFYAKMRPKVDSTCAVVALVACMLVLVGTCGWIVSLVALLLLKLVTLPILLPTVLVTLAAIVWGCYVIWVELSRSELISLGSLVYTLAFAGVVTIMNNIEKILAREDKV